MTGAIPKNALILEKISENSFFLMDFVKNRIWDLILTIRDLVLMVSFNRKWFSDSDGTTLMDFGARK